VPGTLATVDAALRSWGNISLSESLQPAIRAAEDGFRIKR
jgi:gamma-glutamyltranspeptidase